MQQPGCHLHPRRYGDCLMVHRPMVTCPMVTCPMVSLVPIASVLAIALFTIGTEASARAPQPLVPTALVEDVTSTTVEVEFMDYVGSGQVIKLAPRDVLVLSYLKSCEHETITGGSVVLG